MKLSEFWVFMEHEFGASYARVLAKDLVLGALGDRTAQQALDVGVDPRTVWEQVCIVQDVPESRRFGPDIKPR